MQSICHTITKLPFVESTELECFASEVYIGEIDDLFPVGVGICKST